MRGVGMNKTKLYRPNMVGSGQFGVCEKCNLMPTQEGHDGCLGTLNDSIVMNACCGHGDDSQAYIQYWDSCCVRGDTAIAEINKLKVESC